MKVAELTGQGYIAVQRVSDGMWSNGGDTTSEQYVEFRDAYLWTWEEWEKLGCVLNPGEKLIRFGVTLTSLGVAHRA